VASFENPSDVITADSISFADSGPASESELAAHGSDTNRRSMTAIRQEVSLSQRLSLERLSFRLQTLDCFILVDGSTL
jgi:hypothetical protein